MATKIKPTMNGELAFCSDDCPYCILCTERDSFYKYECTKAQVRMGVAELCQPWALALVEKLKYQHPPRVPTGWTCGCGHYNGENLARCAQCERPPGGGDG